MSKCIHELFQHRLLQREGCFHDVDLVSGRKRNTITERKKNEEGKVTLAQIPSWHIFLLLNCLYLPTLKKSINLQDKIGLRFAMYHNEQHQKEKVLFLFFLFLLSRLSGNLQKKIWIQSACRKLSEYLRLTHYPIILMCMHNGILTVLSSLRMLRLRSTDLLLTFRMTTKLPR